MMPARPAPRAPLDLSVPGRYHVVGAGGPGMSALALVLAEMGHRVSGSDIRELPVLERLRAAGVDVAIGHDRAVVHGTDAVTFSTAIPADNVEMDEARRLGVPVVRRAGMLASICAQARALGVAGTHGKTTTTSMLMLVLADAGHRPSFVIGGDVADMGTGAQWTGSEWLVVEADESDLTHIELPLHGTILTNVDVDHLEHYGTFERIVERFEQYLAQVAGPRVLCADDAVCRRFAAELGERGEAGVVTYGTAPDATYRAVDVRAEQGAQSFTVERGGAPLARIELPLRGLHNVRNATAVVAMATEIGIDAGVVTGALARFGGVARRFDVRGTIDGATLVDDYAHVPAEISAVLDAAATSQDGWTRIVAVFQPNRFRRMAVLSPDYRDAFERADLTVITDIYPSGDPPIPGVTGKLVVNAVLDAHPDQRVAWIPHRSDLAEYLVGELRPGDVCISMGCGDIAGLPAEVLELGARRGRTVG